MFIVDSREKDRERTCTWLRQRGADHEVAAMEAGDYLIVCDTGTVVAVERKTVGDLIQSISDGRLHDQMERLLKSYEYVHLLITGKWMSPRHGDREVVAPFTYSRVAFSSIDRRRLTSSLMSVQKAGVVVDHWPSDTDVGSYLLSLKGYYERGEHDSLTVRPRILAYMRRDGLVGQIERMGIPGVGPELADRLAQAYPDIRALVAADVKELQAVPGVGKLKAQKIFEFFGKEAA